ncbi:MAG: patatin-like phospholipase family protein, partial [Hyphomicrobium sp.]
TLPRYGLLDHTVFDGELRRLYGSTEIEDLWLPFFAVSTNLSRFCVNCHRSGPLWRAIRASSSIPVLLPPVYTEDGDMLVDGCLLDNVPVKTMHELKAGPNVVVGLKAPALDRFEVDYEALPSRVALLRLVLNPLRRDRLPEAPGLVTVLMRALMANRRDYLRDLSGDDLALVPPIPEGTGFLDWHRHRALFDAAYAWTRRELAERRHADLPPWLADVLSDAKALPT